MLKSALVPVCLALSLWASACANVHAPLKLAALGDPEGIEAVGTSLPLYQFKSAKWVPGRAVLVNADFRFDVAVQSLEGPALEYSRRTQVNQQHAEALAPMPEADFAGALGEAARGPKMSAAYDRLGQQGSLAAFALLFGDPRARMQVVFDLMHEEAVQQRYMVVSEARELQGDASWLEHQGASVAAFMRSSAVPILSMVAAYGVALPKAGPDATCALGGSQQARGRVLDSGDGYVDLALSDQPPVIVRCPREALGEVKAATEQQP